MSIRIDEEQRLFTLHTQHSTYQMQADAYGILTHLYYGPRAEGAATGLLIPADRGFTMAPADRATERGFAMDAVPQEYPCYGMGDTRSPAFSLQNPDGSVVCDLRYKGYEILSEKYNLKGLPQVHFEWEHEYEASDGEDRPSFLAVDLEDRVSGVEVRLLYTVLPQTDVIVRSAVVTNRGPEPVTLKKVLSANVDFLYGRYDFLSFCGRHAMERKLQRQEILYGTYAVLSRKGASSHQANPLTILAERGTTETAGFCWAMEPVWSGSFVAQAEKGQFDDVRWQAGLLGEDFSYPLQTGDTFRSPEVILSFSDRGFEQLSVNLHDCIRRHILRGPWAHRVRPLLLNSWEGCYFDFDGERICVLAEQARSLGLDMIVMDDGWFGKRDDDNAGLGDWYPNEKKLGGRLPDLIRVIHGMGLRFGIWIEPEMVNEDSDLFRAHPEYVLASPGRPPVHGRNQLVLDFSRKEVVDCIFSQLCETFREEAPDYIKWDFNRALHEAFSAEADDQGRVFYDYMLGVYDLLERIRTRWPELLIEGCAGGGGRFDAGMLYYTPQIWCSDNTDAIDRISIQYGTSFGYPVYAMGAHVSVSPNEQNGRVTPLATRGIVAMSGTFGYELDPEHMPEEEKEEIREQVAAFRETAALTMRGDYIRLTDPTEGHAAAWEIVAKDGSEAVVSAVTLEIHGNAVQEYIRLRRLTPGAVYRLKETGKEYAADMLMYAGFPVPHLMTEYAAHRWHFIRI